MKEIVAICCDKNPETEAVMKTLEKKGYCLEPIDINEPMFSVFETLDRCRILIVIVQSNDHEVSHELTSPTHLYQQCVAREALFRSIPFLAYLPTEWLLGPWEIKTRSFHPIVVKGEQVAEAIEQALHPPRHEERRPILGGLKPSPRYRPDLKVRKKATV